VFLMIDNNLFLFNFLENNILKNKRKKYWKLANPISEDIKYLWKS
jgi:hypothetical protein